MGIQINLHLKATQALVQILLLIMPNKLKITNKSARIQTLDLELMLDATDYVAC